MMPAVLNRLADPPVPWEQGVSILRRSNVGANNSEVV